MGKYKYLTLADRRQIAAQYSDGMRPCDIAELLGVHTATIYRELQRGQTGERDEYERFAYDPATAQRCVQKSIKRKGRTPKISTEV
jgi:Transposase and inactivated derivatives, IS30 family